MKIEPFVSTVYVDFRHFILDIFMILLSIAGWLLVVSYCISVVVMECTMLSFHWAVTIVPQSGKLPENLVSILWVSVISRSFEITSHWSVI